MVYRLKFKLKFHFSYGKDARDEKNQGINNLYNYCQIIFIE